jgi:hypothetical protein
MGSFYRSQHELVFVFKAGPGRHRNNMQLGRYGRNRSRAYASNPGFGRPGEEGRLAAAASFISAKRQSSRALALSHWARIADFRADLARRRVS